MEDLICYSFAALEAWADEHGMERDAQETSIEFTRRLVREVPNLDQETKQLGILHARVLYAVGSMPDSARGTLEAFWSKLENIPAIRTAADSASSAR